MKKFFLFLAIAAAMWQPAAAQTAPDLGILWQKEYPGINIYFAKFSKDGQFIYFSSDKKIGVLSAETGELLPGFDFETEFLYAQDFNISGNGNYLILNSGNITYVFDVNSKKMIKEISKKTIPTISNTYCSDISPDGSMLYIGINSVGSYYVLVFNLLEDKEVTRFKVEGQIKKIKLSNDGRFFVTGSIYQEQFSKKYYDKLILWDAVTNEQVAVLEDIEGSGVGYRHIKYSSNDIYLGSVRNVPYDVHIFDLTTKQMIKTSDISRKCVDVLFLPDNFHFLLAFYDIVKNERTLEMHDFEKQLKVYSIPFTGNLEVYDFSGTWKIFCTLSPTIAMLTNKPTSVNESNPDNNIKLFYENGKVIIEALVSVINPINISLYDIAGNVIYSETLIDFPINSKQSLNVSLHSGFYIGKATTDFKEYTYKLNIIR
jgi:hypothetical protein